MDAAQEPSRLSRLFQCIGSEGEPLSAPGTPREGKRMVDGERIPTRRGPTRSTRRSCTRRPFAPVRAGGIDGGQATAAPERPALRAQQGSA
jgi:hypothetical protein